MNYAFFEKMCSLKGTTPTALSQKLGLSKGNTSNWKNGGNPSVSILVQLADELNCTTDELLGRNKSNTNIGNISNSNIGVLDENSNGIVHMHGSQDGGDEISSEISRIIKKLPLKERSKLLMLVYEFEENFDKKNLWTGSRAYTFKFKGSKALK